MQNVIKDKKSKNVINTYILANLLDSGKIVSLNNANSKKEVLESISKPLDKEKQKELWFNIINKKWDEHDENMCFNEQECIMMKKIIENSGSIEKKDCLNVGVLKTNYKIRKTAERLEILGFIKILVINNKIIYFLDLNFYKEVFKQ